MLYGLRTTENLCPKMSYKNIFVYNLPKIKLNSRFYAVNLFDTWMVVYKLYSHFIVKLIMILSYRFLVINYTLRTKHEYKNLMA